MAIEVILHIQNSDPVLGEIDEMPGPRDTHLKVNKDNVVTVLWPIQQLTFIEILPGQDEQRIIGFVRE
jgi:hypothetical protein